MQQDENPAGFEVKRSRQEKEEEEEEKKTSGNVRTFFFLFLFHAGIVCSQKKTWKELFFVPSLARCVPWREERAGGGEGGKSQFLIKDELIRRGRSLGCVG